jgi:hypothetical protein
LLSTQPQFGAQILFRRILNWKELCVVALSLKQWSF